MQEEASNHTASHLSAALRAPRALAPLVLLMGFLGASLRYLLELALPSQGGFPYATLIVNIFGCFTLEIINQYVGRRLHLPGPLVKSLGIGLVGAFTTLSAFSTECLGFFRDGEVELAAAYIAITIFVTFIASLCGNCIAYAASAKNELQNVLLKNQQLLKAVDHERSRISRSRHWRSIWSIMQKQGNVLFETPLSWTIPVAHAVH